MRFKSFLKAAFTFAAGFMLCVFGLFVIGVLLMIIGLLMFCMVPSVPKGKQPKTRRTPPRKPSAYPPVSGAPAADAYAYSGSVEHYFAELLRSCFPDCTLGENVFPSTLGHTTCAASWECRCGTANTGNFCSGCGKPRPNDAGRHMAESPNLSYVLYRNERPIAAVILCGKYEWNTQQILNTMEACEDSGVPCLRFMKEFRNSANYVVGRINSVLR